MPDPSPAPPSPARRFATVGRRIFHRRMHVGLAVVALMAFCIRPGPLFGEYQRTGVLLSLSLVLVGLAGRAWAAGCAGRHTRRASIEAPRLVTGGPYAWVRNPIYLASIVLGLGMVGLLGDPWMLIPYVAVFMFLYSAIVPAEEEVLRRQFGEEYARYAAHVGRIVPRLLPWREAQPVKFDWMAPLYEARLGLGLVAIYAVLRGAARLRGIG